VAWSCTVRFEQRKNVPQCKCGFPGNGLVTIQHFLGKELYEQPLDSLKAVRKAPVEITFKGKTPGIVEYQGKEDDQL
jgi:hypothetical protein